jgi:hypothetical protein
MRTIANVRFGGGGEVSMLPELSFKPRMISSLRPTETDRIFHGPKSIRFHAGTLKLRLAPLKEVTA